MPKTDIPFETLAADLHGTDWEKRCVAARLLGQSKDPRAVDLLLPDLQDDDWRVRRNAVQALGTLKSPRALEGVLGALKDRTATVRERAAVALGRIKDPSTLPALVEAMIEEKGDRYHVNEGAYQAIRKFGKKAGPALLDALKSRPNIYYVELLAGSGYEVPMDLFIDLAQGNDLAMRRTALTALGERDDPRAVEFLIDVLKNDDLESQTLAVNSLARMGATQAIPNILDLLQDGPLHGPRTGLYQTVSAAFQTFAGIKKDLETKGPGMMMGPATNLPQMMGMIGNEGFQKLNEMLYDMESRADSLKETINLPPGVIDAMTSQTWKFGAMFADARDTKAEHMKLLTGLLTSDVPLTRAAAALSIVWYYDRDALAPLERAAADPDETARRAITWAHAALKRTLE